MNMYHLNKKTRKNRRMKMAETKTHHLDLTGIHTYRHTYIHIDIQDVHTYRYIE